MATLEQAKQSILAKVDPKNQDALARVVKAGMKFMYSEKTNPMVHKALLEGEPAEAIGKGVPTVMGLLMKESRNTIPGAIVVPASFLLGLDALDYLSQTQGFEIDDQMLNATTQSIGENLMKASGVNTQNMQDMHNKSQELMADPKNKALIEQRMAGG